MDLKRFNIRVYGVLFNHSERVLMSDEIIIGQKYTKFPGGGLKLGEGTVDGLKREFMEELGIRISIVDHIYTTDIFQPSVFDDDSQIISVYYQVDTEDWGKIKVSRKKFDLDMINGQEESFRWVKIDKLLKENHFSLPLDRIVGAMLHPLL